MTGIYLKCNECGATLGGEQVTGPERPFGLHWSEHHTLRTRAAERGWRVDASNDEDYCPNCVPLKGEQDGPTP